MKTYEYLYIYLYIIPFIYIDTFSFLLILSAWSITSLHYRDNKVLNENVSIGEGYSFPFWFNVCVVICSITLSYLFVIGCIDDGLLINGIKFLPTYTYLFYVIVPCLWIYAEKIRINQLFNFNKKTASFVILLSLPIVFNNILTVIHMNSQELNNLQYKDLLFEIYQAVFIAAIVEEIFFRGYLYNALKKYLGFAVSLLVSAFIFSVWHLRIIYFLLDDFQAFTLFNLAAIFLLGVLNTWLFEKSRSLIPSIIMHALVNGTFKNILILLSK